MRGKVAVYASAGKDASLGEFWYQGSSAAREVSKAIIAKFPDTPVGAVFKILTQKGKRESVSCLVDFDDGTADETL